MEIFISHSAKTSIPALLTVLQEEARLGTVPVTVCQPNEQISSSDLSLNHSSTADTYRNVGIALGIS